MKRILAIIAAIAVVLLLWFLIFKPTGKNSTAAPVRKDSVARKHSPRFDKEIAVLINAYIGMKNGFVKGDTSVIRQKTDSFIIAADSLHLDELHEQDSSIFMAAQQNISDVKANATPILEERDVAEMRRDFSMVSENMYPFLKTVGYEGPKLYWQNDANAFGEDKPANWLSESAETANPYVGSGDTKSSHSEEPVDSIYSK